MKLRWPTAACLLLLLGGCRGADSDLPREYRRVALPEGLLARESHPRGRQLFLQHCAICHGRSADGHGVRWNLSSRPANFTDPLWRRRTSPRRVFYVIREGVRGTAMAGWKTLDEDQIWDLVAFVLSVAETP